MNYAHKRHTRVRFVVHLHQKNIGNKSAVNLKMYESISKLCIYLSKVILEYIQKDMIYTCENFMLYILYRFYISIFSFSVWKPINYAFFVNDIQII